MSERVERRVGGDTACHVGGKQKHVWQVGCTRRVNRTRVRRRANNDTVDTPSEVLSSKSPHLQGDGVRPYEALRGLAYT